MAWIVRFAAALTVLCCPGTAAAVRPFITDDARVVGDRAAQTETWLRLDKVGPQHWIAGAIGPVAPLEMTLGMVYGRQDKQFTIAAPLLQAKALALETRPGAWWPGLAVSAGTVGPAGTGPLKSESWDTFAYLALSESLDAHDHILFHQNLGVFFRGEPGRAGSITWGLATQIRLIGGLHFVGEVFSGDPYAARPSAAFQTGVRHFISRIVQVDATFGRGVGAEDPLPLWASLGLRIASDPHLF